MPSGKRSTALPRPPRGGPRSARRDLVAGLALRAGLLPLPKGVTTPDQVARMRRSRGMAVSAIPVAPPPALPPAEPTPDRGERRAAAGARAEREALRILRTHHRTVGHAAAERAAARAFAHELRHYPETWDAALGGRPGRFAREAEAWWAALDQRAAAERAADRAG